MIDRPERRNAVDGATAAALLDVFSFLAMCFRWDFTVPSEITKHRAIWPLVAPVAT